MILIYRLHFSCKSHDSFFIELKSWLTRSFPNSLGYNLSQVTKKHTNMGICYSYLLYDMQEQAQWSCHSSKNPSLTCPSHDSAPLFFKCNTTCITGSGGWHSGTVGQLKMMSSLITAQLISPILLIMGLWEVPLA